MKNKSLGRARHFSTKYSNRDSHASDFTIRKNSNCFSVEISRRDTPLHKIITTFDYQTAWDLHVWLEEVL